MLIRQSPHKCRVVLGLPHEVARGGIPLCGQFHVGIEGLSAARHVSPSGMFSCRYEQRRGYMVIRMLPMEKSAGRRNKFLATFHNSFDLMLFNTRHTVMPESFILFLSR